MAGCFQLDTIDHSVTTPPTPPVIKYESLYPPIDNVVKFNLEGGEAKFYIPHIFDANGFEQQQLYGRWFVNYDPEDSSSNFFGAINRKPEPEETDAGTTDDDCLCPGCCWETQFTVRATDFGEGEGCYQILALVSDSDFLDLPGQLLETETPTHAPRIMWWVWAYRGVDPDSPGLEDCGEPAEVNP